MKPLKPIYPRLLQYTVYKQHQSMLLFEFTKS